MADDTILSTDTEEEDSTEDTSSTEQYLLIENYLGEYSDENEKAIVRENLLVPYIENVYNKTDADIMAFETVSKVVNEHLEADDPHGSEAYVASALEYAVFYNTTNTFSALLYMSVTPNDASKLAIANVTYVLSKISDLLDSDDKEDILAEVTTLLSDYVKSSEVYSTSDTYSLDEIDDLLKSYVKRDGSTSFTATLIGKDPTLDGHLATKRYADKILYKHLVDVDPHGFITTLNSRLASYAKLKDVYTLSQTYSRSLIDSIITSAVDALLDAALEAYQEWVTEQLEDQDTYIKKDGSRVFTAAQSGVEGTESSHLTTLGLVNDLISALLTTIESELDGSVWITSGAVEATVGNVEEGTEVPSTMTLLEVCDAIFYGNLVSITAPDYITVAEQGEVTLCVHGSTALITSAVLYLDGEEIATFDGSDFEDGCITVTTNAVTADTTFEFEVTYSSGSVLTDTATSTCSYPVFVGSLPKWKTASTITMEYLLSLEDADEDGDENRFITYGGDGSSITFKYSFEDENLRHILLVIPKSYPELETMTTLSLTFTTDAFDIIDDIELTIDGLDDTVTYRIYVYSLTLASLDSSVTFNFVQE